MEEELSQSEKFVRWQARWTPEAIAERQRQEALARAAERESAPVRELTLNALLDKLGFSREYAEHLMQPYCRCECGHDGWSYCQHAEDLGWPRLDWIKS
jgi:hypothetical protein